MAAGDNVETMFATLQKTYEWLRQLGEELAQEDRRHIDDPEVDKALQNLPEDLRRLFV